MKQHCLLRLRMLVLLTSLAFTGEGFAQNPEAAAAIAASKESQESYLQLKDRVSALEEAQVALQKSLLKLQEEVQLLRADLESSRTAANTNWANYVTLEDFRRFVAELDKRREEDKKLILEQLEKLAKPPPVIREVSKPATNAPAAPLTKNEGGYEYIIQKGDSLSKILADLRKDGFKITEEQILRANPTLKPDRVYAGRKLLIPAPPKEKE